MGLWRSGSLVAALILFGRITGFGREWVLSARAGASSSSDLAIVMLTLPDLLVNLLLGGGLGATLVPMLKNLMPPQRQRLAGQVAIAVGVAFSLLTLLLMMESLRVLELMAPGVSGAEQAGALGALRLSLIAVPLTAMAGVCTALLNACGRFGLGASGTAVFNVLVIAAISSQLPLDWAIAVGVAAGALIRLLAQSLGSSLDLSNTLSRPCLIEKTLVRRFGGNFGFVTALVLLPPIARAWASTTEPGALSLFNYANKLVDLPLGVLMGALSTVLLPHLSSNPNPRTVGLALRVSCLTATGISLLAMQWPAELARLVYYKAPFSEIQLQQLGQITSLTFAFVLPQALVILFGTVFAALGRTRPLIGTGALMVASLLAGAPMGARLGGLNGVAVSYGLVYALGALTLSYVAWQQLGDKAFRIAFGLDKGS